MLAAAGRIFLKHMMSHGACSTTGLWSCVSAVAVVCNEVTELCKEAFVSFVG